MSIESFFVSRIESLKIELKALAADRFKTSYRRINQPVAQGLLDDIETLQREHSEMKEKLSKINELSKLD